MLETGWPSLLPGGNKSSTIILRAGWGCCLTLGCSWHSYKQRWSNRKEKTQLSGRARVCEGAG